MAESLQLVGDGDELDMVRDVEEAFGIEFAKEDAEAWQTLGDMFSTLRREMRSLRQPDLTCPAAIAFHRMRPVLAGDGPLRDIRPLTRLSELPSIHDAGLVPALVAATKMQIPATLSRGSCLLILLSLIGLPAGATAAFGATGLAIALPFGGLATWIVSRRSGRYLDPGKTVGDLAREIGVRNFGALVRAGASSNRKLMWNAFAEIVAMQGGGRTLLHREDIKPETRFC